jgi:hypothetical protein
MRIKILNKGDLVKEAKYSYFELFYTKDGRAEKPKKIMSFNEGFDILKDASKDEEFDVDLVKDDNGYWQWKNPRSAAAGQPSVGTVVASGGSTGKSGAWQTPEERARIQTLIVRQNCMTNAVNAIGAGHDIDEYRGMATDFEEWVNRE